MRVDPERELGLCSLAPRERSEGPEERGDRGEAARLQRRDGRVGTGADAADDRLVGGPLEGIRRLRLDPERSLSDAGEGAFARAKPPDHKPEAESGGYALDASLPSRAADAQRGELRGRERIVDDPRRERLRHRGCL